MTITIGNLSCVPYDIQQFEIKYDLTIEEVEFLELKKKREEINNENI